MTRIAVGGFQHETNCFAPTKADLDVFVTGGAWPGLCEGPALFEATAGINLPVAGFAEAASAAGAELVGLAWAAAEPSNHVTERAFEVIAGKISDRLAAAGPLDALYLDLHGAMVTEHLMDGEGELLRRLRAQVGADLPIAVSLDLHANVSAEMAGEADLLAIYRTYPHIDMAATGALTFDWLQRFLAGGLRHKAFVQVPFLIPLTAGCTTQEPAAGLYRSLEEKEAESGAALSFACGFSPADTPVCGPSALAYADSEAEAQRLSQKLADLALAHETDFATPVFTPEAAVAHALKTNAKGRAPVVLADTQDNPGAGGNGDTVGLLEALVALKAEGAVLGLLADAESAAQAHALGEGTVGHFALGAKSGIPGHKPFETEARVVSLGDGRFTCTGLFYEGSRMELGPMALLDVQGVRVALCSRKTQAADREMFRHLGVEPADAPILGLKSSVHFRADFDPIAAETLVVAAPGPNPVDHLALDYRHLRPGLRLVPGGPAYAG
ncbi:MAG: M81 family metallopeptidase [Rhodospirillales bacterium]